MNNSYPTTLWLEFLLYNEKYIVAIFKKLTDNI